MSCGAANEILNRVNLNRVLSLVITEKSLNQTLLMMRTIY